MRSRSECTEYGAWISQAAVSSLQALTWTRCWQSPRSGRGRRSVAAEDEWSNGCRRHGTSFTVALGLTGGLGGGRVCSLSLDCETLSTVRGCGTRRLEWAS